MRQGCWKSARTAGAFNYLNQGPGTRLFVTKPLSRFTQALSLSVHWKPMRHSFSLSANIIPDPDSCFAAATEWANNADAFHQKWRRVNLWEKNSIPVKNPKARRAQTHKWKMKPQKANPGCHCLGVTLTLANNFGLGIHIALAIIIIPLCALRLWLWLGKSKSLWGWHAGDRMIKNAHPW